MRRRFRSGFGRLTAAQLTDAVSAGARDREMGNLVEEMAGAYERTPKPPEWILAKITGSTAIAGTSNRWEYSFTEQVLTSTLGVSDGVITDANTGKALNLCEMLNDGSATEGPGWDVSSGPSGFAIQPIEACLVMMFPYNLDDGTFRYVFFATNVFDGTCDP